MAPHTISNGEMVTGPPGLGERLDLEATDVYLRRAKADAHRSKARAAHAVALILVLGFVLSLPFYVLVVVAAGSEATAAHVERIYLKWYDVLSPLVGAVIGALFGLTWSDRGAVKGRDM